MSDQCLHLGASSAGYVETRIERPDPSVAGLTLYAGVCTCPGCGELVVSVSLHPQSGGPPVLRTAGPVPLVPRRRDDAGGAA